MHETEEKQEMKEACETEEAYETEEAHETEEVYATEERQEMEENKKKSGYGFYIVLAAVVLGSFAFRAWWTSTFGGVQVDGSSMEQTLQDGENLLMKFVHDGKGLERGDIIVVNVGGYEEFASSDVQFIIKRLIAVEGDKVKCTDGQISICYAGTTEYVPLVEEYAYYGGMPGKEITDYDFAEYVVQEDEIFFLGDNRFNSCDSRYQEMGGSHLKGRLYKETDVYGVVPEWALEHQELIAKICFR